jgi:hypothetical protein
MILWKAENGIKWNLICLLSEVEGRGERAKTENSSPYYIGHNRKVFSCHSPIKT